MTSRLTADCLYQLSYAGMGWETVFSGGGGGRQGLEGLRAEKSFGLRNKRKLRGAILTSMGPEWVL